MCLIEGDQGAGMGAQCGMVGRQGHININGSICCGLNLFSVQFF